MEKINELVKLFHKQGYNNLCIFQPAYNLGGGSYVEANIAKYIATHTDIRVSFCDYKDGYADFILKNTPEVKKLYYDEKSLNFPLQEKTVLITNSTRAILLQNMNDNNKIIFWHYETIPCGWDLVFINDEAEKYLKLLKEEKAIVYHDWSARNILNRQYSLGLDNDDYIYITLDKKSKESSSKLIDEKSLNIAFLGRLAPEKIQGLFYLIKNYAAYPTEKKKRLHIIGDGYSKKDVENFCKKYESKIEFIFYGSVPRGNLDDCLIRNADMLFAVGTCVLEGASLKIPSAVLLMDLHSFEENDAFWVYHSKDYCVGILKEQKKEFDVQYTSIHNMLDSIYHLNEKHIIGTKCYNYYIDQHSNQEKLIYDFLKLTLKSTLTFKKLKKCIKYIPYTNIITNKYKFFGICFKIIKHSAGIDYWLFNRRVLKIRNKAGSQNYYIGGLCVLRKKSSTPYRFPATQWKDKFK